MTGKHGNKHYNKGKGANREGRLTSKGRFIPDVLKKKYLKVPEGVATESYDGLNAYVNVNVDPKMQKGEFGSLSLSRARASHTP